MKLKKIRNALLVVLTLALVSATTVALTWAYVNKTLTEAENTFTNNENIALDITEPDWDGEIKEGKEYTPANNYNPGDAVTTGITKGKNDGKTLADSYYPGLDIPKDPRITNISNPTTTDNAVKAASQEIIGANLQFIVKDGATEYAYPSYDAFKKNIATVKYSASKTPGYNATWAKFSDDDDLNLYFTKTVGWKGQTDHIFDWVTINPVNSEDVGAGKTYTTLNDVPVDDVDGIYTDGTNYSVKVYDKTLNNGAGGYKRIQLTKLPDFDIKIKGYAVQSQPFGLEDGASIASNDDAKNALKSLMGLS